MQWIKNHYMTTYFSFLIQDTYQLNRFYILSQLSYFEIQVHKLQRGTLMTTHAVLRTKVKFQTSFSL